MQIPRKTHVHAWLLLMPAAILLIAFTHYPTVTTVVKSLFSKGRQSGPPGSLAWTTT